MFVHDLVLEGWGSEMLRYLLAYPHFAGEIIYGILGKDMQFRIYSEVFLKLNAQIVENLRH